MLPINRNDRQILDTLVDDLTWRGQDWQRITSLSTYIPFLGNSTTTENFKNGLYNRIEGYFHAELLIGKVSVVGGVIVGILAGGRILPRPGDDISDFIYFLSGFCVGYVFSAGILLISAVTTHIVATVILGVVSSLEVIKEVYDKWSELRSFRNWAAQFKTLAEAANADPGTAPPQALEYAERLRVCSRLWERKAQSDAKMAQYDAKIYKLENDKKTVENEKKKLEAKLMSILAEQAAELTDKLEIDKNFYGDSNYLRKFDADLLRTHYPDLFKRVQENMQNLPPEQRLQLYTQKDEGTWGLTSAKEEIELAEMLRMEAELAEKASELMAKLEEDADFYGDSDYLKNFSAYDLRIHYPDLFKRLQENMQILPPQQRLQLYNEWDERTWGLTSVKEDALLNVEALRKAAPQVLNDSNLIQAGDREKEEDQVYPSSQLLNDVLNSRDLLSIIERNLDGKSAIALARSCKALYHRVRNDPALKVLNEKYLTGGYDICFPKQPLPFQHLSCPGYSLYFRDEGMDDKVSNPWVASGPGWLLIDSLPKNDPTVNPNAAPGKRSLELLELNSDDAVTAKRFDKETFPGGITRIYSGHLIASTSFFIVSTDPTTRRVRTLYALNGRESKVMTCGVDHDNDSWNNWPQIERHLIEGRLGKYQWIQSIPGMGLWRIVDGLLVWTGKNSFRVLDPEKGICRDIPRQNEYGSLISVGLNMSGSGWIESDELGSTAYWKSESEDQVVEIGNKTNRVICDKGDVVFYSGNYEVFRKNDQQE